MHVSCCVSRFSPYTLNGTILRETINAVFRNSNLFAVCMGAERLETFTGRKGRVVACESRLVKQKRVTSVIVRVSESFLLSSASF